MFCLKDNMRWTEDAWIANLPVIDQSHGCMLDIRLALLVLLLDSTLCSVLLCVRSWLHHFSHQCDSAEGVWVWRDLRGQWREVQGRVHQHGTSSLPQVKWHGFSSAWTGDHFNLSMIVPINKYVLTYLLSGSRRPKETVSGSPRFLTVRTTWTLCLAPPRLTETAWDATRKGPSRYGETR